jgi:hypothetical protein
MFSKLIRKVSNFLMVPFIFKNWIQVIGYVLSVYIPIPALKKNTGVVTLRKGTKFKIRLINALDLGSIIETHQKKVYTPKIFNIPDNAKIVDIGSSIGDFSVFCSFSFKNAKCFCFEPIHNAFEICKENIILNKLDNKINAYRLAVSDKNGEIAIGGDICDSVTLEEIFKEIQIDRCDLLKIDIEGAEYNALLCTPMNILYRINAIAMECHIYDNSENLYSLRDYLINAGFNVIITKIACHNVCYLYAMRH